MNARLCFAGKHRTGRKSPFLVSRTPLHEPLKPTSTVCTVNALLPSVADAMVSHTALFVGCTQWWSHERLPVEEISPSIVISLMLLTCHLSRSQPPRGERCEMRRCPRTGVSAADALVASCVHLNEDCVPQIRP